jgi:sec-independent protein translocase protein TatC
MANNPHAAQMTLIEHLTELRKRLMVSFLAIAIGAIVCWVLYDQILDVLLRPYCNSIKPGENCDLIVTSPLEPFNVKLTVAGYGGITLAIPVVLWQIWRFIAPGLHRHEKKYAIPFILSGVGLFGLGSWLAYWSIPKALEFLASMGGENFIEFYKPTEYIGFVIKMIVAFGVAFEFPILLIFLQILGILDNETLRKGRQYAMVGIVVIVAVITPSGDPFTLMVLSVPMYLFYEISILFGRIRTKRQLKARAQSETVEADA